MLTQAKMAETQVKAKTAEIDAQTKLAEIQTQNIDAITKRQIAKTDAINHAQDRNAKLQLEGLKLQQSQLVHRDKLTLDERLHDKSLMNASRIKGLDLAQAADQAAADRMHDALKDQAAARRTLTEGE